MHFLCMGFLQISPQRYLWQRQRKNLNFWDIQLRSRDTKSLSSSCSCQLLQQIKQISCRLQTTKLLFTPLPFTSCNKWGQYPTVKITCIMYLNDSKVKFWHLITFGFSNLLMLCEHSFLFISFLQNEQAKNAKASLCSIIAVTIRA